MKPRLNIMIREDLYLKLKAIAFHENKSMNAVIQEFIEAASSPDAKWYKEWIKEQKSKEVGK